MKTSSSKNQIGAAFKALKVNEPYNLKYTKPAFVQPEPVLDTLVSTVTKDATVAMDSAHTQASAVTEASLPSQVTPVTMDTIPALDATNTMNSLLPKATPTTKVTTLTLDSTPTLATPVTMVTEQSQVTTFTKVDSSAKTSANEVSNAQQTSAVHFESGALSGLAKGYTRVPNVLLMHIVSGQLIRSEVMVALLIARFTISFNRDTVPLSKSVIERQTGLTGAAVLEALDGLIQKKVIHKVKGDHKSPNLFGLTKAFELIESTKPPTLSTTQTKVNTPTLDTQVTDPLVTVVSNTGGGVLPIKRTLFG